MPRVLPSQVVAAIDNLFGPNRNELDSGAVRHVFRSEVYTLLALLEQVPPELINLDAQDLLELGRCRGVLATALPGWNMGDIMPAKAVGGKDVVERVRRLMAKCHDDMPPAAPEFPFIQQDDVRHTIEGRVRSAWTDFQAQEWTGATVLGGAALEALLFWALKQRELAKPTKRPLDTLHLSDLIEAASENNLIDSATVQQVTLAKDARNLIHPGRAERSGDECTKATALTAFAAVFRTADALKKTIGGA